MTREEIKDIIPHREPMLLVDEIHENDDGTVTGSYTVRGDEFFLQGHFPDNPIVPGVMLCEMAGQCSCLLLADKVKGKKTLYTGMKNVKFKNPVYPGDKVEFRCEHTRSIGVFHFMKAEGRVKNKVVLKGEFSFALIDSERVNHK